MEQTLIIIIIIIIKFSVYRIEKRIMEACVCVCLCGCCCCCVSDILIINFHFVCMILVISYILKANKIFSLYIVNYRWNINIYIYKIDSFHN